MMLAGPTNCTRDALDMIVSDYKLILAVVI